jgi:hypothetical protein
MFHLSVKLNLVSHVRGTTWADSVWEYGKEEDVWALTDRN